MINEIVTIGDVSMPLTKFIDMIAVSIANKIKDKNQPRLITQRQAHLKYGRRNVETWLRTGELDLVETTTKRKYIKVADIEEVSAGHEGYIR